MALFRSTRPAKPPPGGRANAYPAKEPGDLESRIAAVRPGFYGKVQTYGDFVGADLDPRFQAALDSWLQQSLGAARQKLGDRFDTTFLSAPAWRFTMAAGVCGPRAMTGLFLPSRDRIGRCFPFVIAARRSLDGETVRIVYDEHWFIATEAVGRTGLHEDFDLASFREKLRRIRPPRDLADRGGPAAAKSGSLFWTPGDAIIRPKEFAFDALPGPDRFVDFLTVSPDSDLRASELSDAEPPVTARGRQTSTSETEIEDGHKAVSDTIAASGPPDSTADRGGVPRKDAVPPARIPRTELKNVTVRWATRSHVHDGPRAPQLDVVESEDPRLAAVMAAGTSDRVTPKVMAVIRNVLNAIPPHETVEEIVAEVKGKLGRAHALLRGGNVADGGAGTKLPEDFSISLAIAIVRSGQLAVMWIGDCRGYLMRDGMMRSLTRDHVEVGMRRRLSRSIGGSNGSALVDTVIDVAQPGDRVMICSRGLPKILTDRAIAGLLLDGEPSHAAEALIQEAILTGSSDSLATCVGDVVSLESDD